MENKTNKQIRYVRKYYSHPLNWAIMMLALMASWYHNHSILWLIFHWIFAPAYLIYTILIGRFADGQFMQMIHYYF